MSFVEPPDSVIIPDSLVDMLTPHDLPTICELAAYHANALLRHLAQASAAVGQPDAPYLDDIARCLAQLDDVLETLTSAQ